MPLGTSIWRYSCAAISSARWRSAVTSTTPVTVWHLGSMRRISFVSHEVPKYAYRRNPVH